MRKAKRRRMPRYTWRPREGEKSALCNAPGFVRKAEMRECAKLQRRFTKFFDPTTCYVHITKKSTNPIYFSQILY